MAVPKRVHCLEVPCVKKRDTFLLGTDEEGDLSVPVWLAAAAQDTERLQGAGVKDTDTRVLPIQHQEGLRIFGTG